MNKIILGIALILIIVGVYFTTSNNDDNVDINNEDGNEEMNKMTFFITSENPGTGANFGGLSGADAHCQTLAESAGAGNLDWKAYLSAKSTESSDAVNARDRIGSGPWYNFNGVLVANNIEELHSDANKINKETGLSEKGEQINGRGDSPNVHDILTGSTVDGMVSSNEGDTTCNNWTSESADGSAIVGHHDRMGLDESDGAKSWNSSHGSRGCSLENLNSTGGGGLLYCFATSE